MAFDDALSEVLRGLGIITSEKLDETPADELIPDGVFLLPPRRYVRHSRCSQVVETLAMENALLDAGLEGGAVFTRQNAAVICVHAMTFIRCFAFASNMVRAHLKISSHFGRRCIPSGCVAKNWNIQIFLRFRALTGGA